MYAACAPHMRHLCRNRAKCAVMGPATRTRVPIQRYAATAAPAVKARQWIGTTPRCTLTCFAMSEACFVNAVEVYYFALAGGPPQACQALERLAPAPAAQGKGPR